MPAEEDARSTRGVRVYTWDSTVAAGNEMLDMMFRKKVGCAAIAITVNKSEAEKIEAYANEPPVISAIRPVPIPDGSGLYEVYFNYPSTGINCEFQSRFETLERLEELISQHEILNKPCTPKQVPPDIMKILKLLHSDFYDSYHFYLDDLDKQLQKKSLKEIIKDAKKSVAGLQSSKNAGRN